MVVVMWSAGVLVQEVAETLDTREVVSGCAEGGSGIRVDCLVVDKNHLGHGDAEFRRDFEVDARFRFERIHLGADEDTLEIAAERREPKGAGEVEPGIGEDCKTGTASMQLCDEIESPRFNTDPAAKVDRPQPLDIHATPGESEVTPNSRPVGGNIEIAAVQFVAMPVIGRPEGGSIGGRNACDSENDIPVFGCRRKRYDLAIVENDDASRDVQWHGHQTIVRDMTPEAGAPPSETARYENWNEKDAADWIAIPAEDDDKYSRGVLGVITGSEQYPGAAVLGVEAALRTGVGMVRYVGPRRASDLVLARRPEVVTGVGRVQAWLIGSGMDAAAGGGESAKAMTDAVAEGVPVVLDGGAFDLVGETKGPAIITPHFRELARVIGGDAGDVAKDPAGAAARAAEKLGVTVLLKGHTTYVAAPDGIRLSASVAPSWLATAGAGDALGGILGALVATHTKEIATDASALARLGATASVIHGLAAELASAGGPLTVLDVAAAVPAVIARMLARR